jgi:hypothetical protein
MAFHQRVRRLKQAGMFMLLGPMLGAIADRCGVL